MSNKTWEELLAASHRSLQPFWTTELVPTLVGESKGLGFVSAENNQNLLIVGRVGAGKSVLVNQLINQIALDNSPRNVRFWLSDCKGVEFTQYLPKDGVFLPHIDVCAVTPDWHYHLQVLEELRNEACRRYEMIKAAGCKTMEAFNKKAEEGNTNTHMPILFYVCDEFQKLFEHQEAQPVLEYLIKTSRATGIRLILSSQSSTDTLTKDAMLAFRTRIVLKCDKRESVRLLGSELASDIKENYGVAYYSDSPVDNICVRVELPYISDEAVSLNIDRLYHFCEEMYPEILKQDRIFFHPTRKDPSLEEFEKSYAETYKEVNVPNGAIFLGDRLVFDKSKAHCNIILSRRKDMHVLACFPKANDYASFLNTIWVNKCIQKDSDVTFITLDDGITAIRNIECNLKKEIVSQMVVKSSYNALEARLKAISEGTRSSLYMKPRTIVLCGFEKVIGADNVRQFKELLSELGEKNVHIIMVVPSMKGIDKFGLEDSFFFKICGKTKVQDSLVLLNTYDASTDYDDTDEWAILSYAGQHMRYKYFKINICKSSTGLDIYQLNF